jgi:dihydrofolate synthase/folylpolyglutamate synthase
LRENGCRLGDRQISRGLAAARWPGRFQIKPGHPLIIYDVAHNAAAARGLAEALPEVVGRRKVTAVCAVADDKDWRKMLRFLAPLVNTWYFTRFPNPRSWRLSDVRRFAGERRLPFVAGRDPREMVRLAVRKTPRDGVVLVFGSHFLVGQVIPQALIDPAPLAPPAGHSRCRSSI